MSPAAFNIISRATNSFVSSFMVKEKKNATEPWLLQRGVLYSVANKLKVTDVTVYELSWRYTTDCGNPLVEINYDVITHQAGRGVFAG